MASSGTETLQDSVSIKQEDTVSLVRSIISSVQGFEEAADRTAFKIFKAKIVDDKRVSFKYNGN